MPDKKVTTSNKPKKDLELVDLTPRKVKSAKVREISITLNSNNVSQNTSSLDLKSINQKSKSKKTNPKKARKHPILKNICITIILSIIGAVICFIIALKY